MLRVCDKLIVISADRVQTALKSQHSKHYSYIANSDLNER